MLVTEKIIHTQFLVYDLEMSGLDPESDEILEIASIPMHGSEIVEDEGFFVQLHPIDFIEQESRQVHGISYEGDGLSEKPKIETALPQFFKHAQGRVLVGQRPALDLDFLQYAGKISATIVPRFQIIDISRLFLYFFPNVRRYNLDEIAINFGFRKRTGSHNAWDDAFTTASIFRKMILKLNSTGKTTLGELLHLGRLL